MIKIKFTCNWTTDRELMERVKANYITEENFDPRIEFTVGKDYDFLFVFNRMRVHPLMDVFNKTGFNPFVNKDRIYTFIIEPSWSPHWDRNCLVYSKKVFAHDKSLYGNHPDLIEAPTFMFYHLDFRKHDIGSLLRNDHFDKKKKMSMVVSCTPDSKTGNYRKRTELAFKLLEKGFDVDIYGKGWTLSHPNIKGPVQDKFDALIDYRYSIGIENCCEKNYLTEKYFDISLCNAIPLYYGAPNVSEIYKNHVLLDLNNMEQCLDTISDVMNRNDFNIEGIIENKQRYFTRYNVYNKVKEIVKDAL